MAISKKRKGKKPNDGNLANNYPPYDKVTRGDVIAGALGQDQMGGKRRVAKEEYSNWREDLSEVMGAVKHGENDRKIEEKKGLDNSRRLKINPPVSEEKVTVLEMIELDELDDIIESMYDSLLDEGYEEDDIEAAIEYALTESVHPSFFTEKKTLDIAEEILTEVRQSLFEIKGFSPTVKKLIFKVKKTLRGDQTPHPAFTSTRSARTYRGVGVGRKETVSSGSYVPPKKPKATSTPSTPASSPTSYSSSSTPTGGSFGSMSRRRTPTVSSGTLVTGTRTTRRRGTTKPQQKTTSKFPDPWEIKEENLDEKITGSTDIGTAIKDFYSSTSPQLKGRSKEQRRQAAIAAVLTARRGGRKLKEDTSTGASSSQTTPQSSNSKAASNQKQVINLMRQALRNKLQLLGKGVPVQSENVEIIDEEEYDNYKDHRLTSGMRGRRHFRRDVSLDPRYGSLSDDEWARSPQNPANQSRSRTSTRTTRSVKPTSPQSTIKVDPEQAKENLRKKGKIPTKGGKKMFENYLDK